ncbi:MAG: L-rhamnose/proton symporter RhaT [Armatimonadota bacterium]
MNPLIPGFGLILVAAVCGGAFGLQYRIMRRYTVDNAALLSMFFATIVIPLIAINILLPGWFGAIKSAGFKANLLVYLLGFGWGLGAMTYSYSFSILGMALAAAILKGLSIAVGSGIPLFRHWGEVPMSARLVTLIGIAMLVVGAGIAGKAGIMRERDAKPETDEEKAKPMASSVIKCSGKIFWIGLITCLISGVLSACANLGYEYAEPLAKSANGLGNMDLWATLIRWMPMYWGGISAMIIFMGGNMLRQGTWRNYFAPGSGRDFAISSSMGVVHFMAQIPYGIGAFFLGTLGTTIGFGANIGMALIVAASLGFITGEWKGVSKAATNTLYTSIGVLLAAIAVLAYANSLA